MSLSWPELSRLRWGHAVGDLRSGVDLPVDWRSRAAVLPHAEWVRWRARSAEIQRALGHAPTAVEIREADREAFAEMEESP